MKVRRADRPEFTPAAIHLLMLGTDAPAPCAGSFGLYFDHQKFDHDLHRWRKAMASEVIAWLTAEAREYGFEPWAVTGRRPTGAGVTRWKAAFRAEYGGPR